MQCLSEDRLRVYGRRKSEKGLRRIVNFFQEFHRKKPEGAAADFLPLSSGDNPVLSQVGYPVGNQVSEGRKGCE